MFDFFWRVWRKRRRPAPLRAEFLDRRDLPSAPPVVDFEQVAPPATPDGWSVWADASPPAATPAYATSAARPLSGTQSLVGRASSGTTARFWRDAPETADLRVSASVFADSLVPTQVLARGSDLGTASPTFYSVSVTRGLQLELSKTVAGVTTVLASEASAGYFSGKWVRVSLTAQGPQIGVRAERLDTGEFLNAEGQWQDDPVDAVRVRDTSIGGAGLVGIGRPARYSGATYVDDIEVRSLAPVVYAQNFDAAPSGGLPEGWERFGTAGSFGFRVSTAQSLSPDRGLGSLGRTVDRQRAWLSESQEANVTVSSAVLANSLIPAEVIARGSDLETAKPTYYAATVTRGLEVGLVRVVDGVTTPLGSVRTAGYLSGRWLRVSLSAEGTNLRVSVQRLETAQWLNAAGQWQAAEVIALERADGAIAAGGRVGLGRRAGVAGTLTFDDFRAVGPAADIDSPVVRLTGPGDGAVASGSIAVTADAADDRGVQRVEFLLNGVLRASAATSPYRWDLDTRSFPDGDYTLGVRAYDKAGNIGEDSRRIRIDNSATRPPLPNIPRHYDHIRFAALAYSGNPMGAFEQRLLRESVDLVVPNVRYLSTIDAVAPETPQLVYTNVSNLYLSLMTDWNAHADAQGVSRELAFYHASRATPFEGQSASAVPVRFLLAARQGPAAPASWATPMADVTSRTRTGSEPVALGEAGRATYLGYAEKFNELTIDVRQAPGAGWTAVVEYVSATDAAGNPTQWKALPLLSDGTAGLSRDGPLRFNPPSDWRAARVAGSDPLMYLRVRVVTGTAASAPRLGTVHTPDYVNATTAADGTPRGVTPAFDLAADGDGDGYLTDAEFARRAPGMDARFLYQSRLQHPGYGQMRFTLNPASEAVQDWVSAYHARQVAANPTIEGFFVDNSNGRFPLVGEPVRESTASYPTDYAALLGRLSRELSPRYLFANTVPAGPETDLVARQVAGTVEEFALRPLNANWSAFEGQAELVRNRLALTAPSPYLVLDTNPSRPEDVTDPRALIAALSNYYLLADADKTFLMLWGGYEPASTWERHWTEAIGFDVGAAQGAFTQLATGADPANAALTYRVYQRRYENALVLFKPLSYKLGVGTGTTAADTATTHVLNGPHRELRSDGTLGEIVTSVRLMNGQGVILVPA